MGPHGFPVGTGYFEEPRRNVAWSNEPSEARGVAGRAAMRQGHGRGGGTSFFLMRPERGTRSG